jgi:hypothetical protein
MEGMYTYLKSRLHAHVTRDAWDVGGVSSITFHILHEAQKTKRTEAS